MNQKAALVVVNAKAAFFVFSVHANN